MFATDAITVVQDIYRSGSIIDCSLITATIITRGNNLITIDRRAKQFTYGDTSLGGDLCISPPYSLVSLLPFVRDLTIHASATITESRNELSIENDPKSETADA